MGRGRTPFLTFRELHPGASKYLPERTALSTNCKFGSSSLNAEQGWVIGWPVPETVDALFGNFMIDLTSAMGVGIGVILPGQRSDVCLGNLRTLNAILFVALLMRAMLDYS